MKKDEAAKNPAAVTLGRLGGKVKSAAKTAAARANVRTRWERYRAKHGEKKP
jgi:hypothetical protein